MNLKQWNLSDTIDKTINDYNDNLATIQDEFDGLGHQIRRYGVRRQVGATTAELERLGDAVGKIANADTNLITTNKVVNDFDTIFPWSHIRNCILTEVGKLVYEGDPLYLTTEGDWMVEVPSFYLKHISDGVNTEYWASEFGGADYEKIDKFYIGRFKTSSGHKSIPHVIPLVVTSRPNFRIGARGKGDGWQILDNKAHYVMRTLYQIEFAHLNSQLKLGTGVTSMRYVETDTALTTESNTNRIEVLEDVAKAFNVGATAYCGTSRGNTSIFSGRIITAINQLASNWEIVFDGPPVDMVAGRVIYSMGQHGGKTLSLTSKSGTSKGTNGSQSITYRGVEDIFGNVDEWVDGILVSNHQSYTCENPNNYADTLTEHYKEVGYINLATNGYPRKMGYDVQYKDVEFPIEVGGGTTTGYCDYYYQDLGLRAPRVGGAWYYGSGAGLFDWYVNGSPAGAGVSIGSRLVFRP